MTADADEGVVHEAVGPPMSGLEAAGAIGVGVNSLLVLGVIPVLLGSLADEHRLSNADIGDVASVEVLTMGVATGLVGILLKPQRLKLIGVLCQLLLAIAFAVWIMPAFGSDGGFLALTLCALIGVFPALISPSRLADLNPGEAVPGAPPLRGWIALAGTLVYVSGSASVGVYLQPLAHQAGLSAGVARTALWVSLAAQVAGGAAATALAGRVRWFHVFLITTTGYLIVWALFGLKIPAWLFVGANALAGLVGLFLGPFLVPMTIEADPSRRAAVQSGAAQLIGGAIGPALAAMAVSDADVHGALWLGAALSVTGLAAVAWLHVTHARHPAGPAPAA